MRILQAYGAGTNERGGVSIPSPRPEFAQKEPTNSQARPDFSSYFFPIPCSSWPLFAMKAAYKVDAQNLHLASKGVVASMALAASDPTFAARAARARVMPKPNAEVRIHVLGYLPHAAGGHTYPMLMSFVITEHALPENELCPLGNSAIQNARAVAARHLPRKSGLFMRSTNLQVEFLTHINYAFALIGEDYRVAAMNSFDHELYRRTIALKKRNRALKVSIAIGGWAVSGPPFSNMARTPARRAVFIQSVVDLLNTYGFDGVDLDWEYPVSPDRDGAPEDRENYVHLVKELRRALGPSAEISVAIPASFWYLQHFDVAGMAPHINWFNIMSYDIHGTWDGDSEWTEALVQPHTNLTEIDDGLNLLWRSGIDPSQVVLGLGFYGRSFTLEDPACTSPMCPFSGGAEPGSCIGTSGVLSNAEIREIMDRTGVTPEFDPIAGVKWISWEGQWVSYDDDLDERGSPNLRALATADTNFPAILRDVPGGIFLGARRIAALNEQTEAGLFASTNCMPFLFLNQTVILTNCSQVPVCPPGFKKLTEATGYVSFSPASLSELTWRSHWSFLDQTAGSCPSLRNPTGNICDWVGTPLFCNGPDSQGGCPAGSVHLASNNRPPDAVLTASPLLLPRPCDEFDAGGMLLAGGAAGSLYSDRLPGFQRRRQFELMEENEVDEPLSGVGDFASCHQRRGLEYGVAGAIGITAYIIEGIWADGDKALDFVPDTVTTCTNTTTVHTTTTTSTTVTRTCDASKWPQACHHYNSVARNMWASSQNPANGQNELLCPHIKPTSRRSLPDMWNVQHEGWKSWLPKAPPGVRRGCERDEFPFIRFYGYPGITTQYLRVLPGPQNGAAGIVLVQRVCSNTMPSTVSTKDITADPSQNCYLTIETKRTQIVLSISYSNWDDDWDNTVIWDDMLRQNECLPSLNFNDQGFALMTDDPWYTTGSGSAGVPYDYRLEPPLSVIQGVTPHRVVNSNIRFSEEDGLGIVEDRNSSRKATPEELMEHLGILPCLSPNCRDEKAALGLDEDGNPVPRHNEATATTAPSTESALAVEGYEPGGFSTLPLPSRQTIRPEVMAEVTDVAGETLAPEPTDHLGCRRCTFVGEERD
ncbi:glycoside hydrolase family 18 protein [Sodiomyces alcalophilus JCM 7366]|uniref:glycoside hydrolase family 18 protein n=1 Tax=Sodiomyces alcalophilus JCM 7366 TaxID=591952 RepID=UPI0039B4DB97